MSPQTPLIPRSPLAPATPTAPVDAPLTPARALLSPTWIAALAVLGVNDHLLKGAGILPEVLTGKLSDVAGMLVAPTLLAALTRTTSRRGLFLCHLAVGAVFAAINLSSQAASMWSGLMGVTGFPWRITVDPSDLLALPALYLSWRILSPAMTQPLSRPRLRSLEGALAATGLCLSVATSPNEPWDEDWWANSLQADVYLQNISEVPAVVRLRSLDEAVAYRCEDLADNPGILSESAFGPASSMSLGFGNMVRARTDWENQPCYAILVEGDTFPQTLLFWLDGDVQEQWIEGNEAEEGGVILDWDGDRHTIEATKRPQLIQPLADPEAPPANACALQEDRQRLAWTRAPSGSEQIAAISVGPDDCLGVSFSTNPGADWYVCLPPEVFPFEAGDWILSESIGDTLSVRRVAGPGQEPLTEFAELYLSRGELPPPLIDTSLTLNRDLDCAPIPDECGTVSRPMSVTAQRSGSSPITLTPGMTTMSERDGSLMRLHVAIAQERLVVDSRCSEGPGRVGSDLEIAASYVWGS